MADYPFYGGTPPHVDQDTSRDAAQAIRAPSPVLREQVFGVIVANNGATDDEVEVELTMRHQTASARRRELVIAGRVVDGGQRRPTRSGKNAIVWIIA